MAHAVRNETAPAVETSNWCSDRVRHATGVTSAALACVAALTSTNSAALLITTPAMRLVTASNPTLALVAVVSAVALVVFGVAAGLLLNPNTAPARPNTQNDGVEFYQSEDEQNSDEMELGSEQLQFLHQPQNGRFNTEESQDDESGSTDPELAALFADCEIESDDDSSTSEF